MIYKHILTRDNLLKIKKFLSNRIKDITMLNFRLIYFIKNINSTENSDIEVYSLVGHYHLWMYLVSIFSFKDSFDFDFKITVFDDGTLTEQDKRILREKIKGVLIFDRNVIDKRVINFLKNYPYIKKYREKSFLMRKLIDPVILCSKNCCVVLDSDIIFFDKAPKLERELLINANNGIITTTKSKDANSYVKLNSHTVFSEYFNNSYKSFFKKNIEFIPYANFGFNKFYKNIIDFEEIEKFLEFFDKHNKVSLSKKDLFCLEQTLFIYCLSILNRKNLKFFREEYFPLYFKQKNLT